MQISVVSLAFTWPCRLCLLRVLLCVSLCYKLSPSKHTGKGDTAPVLSGLHVYLQFMWEVGLPPLLWSFPPTAAFTSFPAPDYWAVLLLLPATMFVYSSCGKWVFPPLLWSFPPSATLTRFPALGCWARTPALARASLACPACLFTVRGRIPFPKSLALSAPHPLSHVSLFYYCLLISFSFFPGWGSVCPGGYAALAQACLWENRGTGKLTWSASSQAIWMRATRGPGPSSFLRLM
jgi:hypothetical protein